MKLTFEDTASSFLRGLHVGSVSGSSTLELLGSSRAVEGRWVEERLPLEGPESLRRSATLRGWPKRSCSLVDALTSSQAKLRRPEVWKVLPRLERRSLLLHPRDDDESAEEPSGVVALRSRRLRFWRAHFRVEGDRRRWRGELAFARREWLEERAAWRGMLGELEEVVKLVEEL